MSDPRYDGSADAPFARGSLCVEEGCGQERSHRNHDETSAGGHFFNSGGPLVSQRDDAASERGARGPRASQPLNPVAPLADAARAKRPHIPKERREQSARRGKDTRICVHCGRPRGVHRGLIDHRFEPPGAETTAPEFVCPTIGQIADAFERVVRGMGIAPRMHLRNTQVKPQYAPGSDTEMLSAHVLLDVALIFPREAK